MILQQLSNNHMLHAVLIAWFLAQFLKVPMEYLLNHNLNWGLWFSSGGMPSSHSALVTAAVASTGLYSGFDTPAFAVAVALAMVVVYDATGVRRQAGIQAQRINTMISELFMGHPISEERLKEVLGHTPRQVIAGVLLGIAISVSVWLIWPPVN